VARPGDSSGEFCDCSAAALLAQVEFLLASNLHLDELSRHSDWRSAAEVVAEQMSRLSMCPFTAVSHATGKGVPRGEEQATHALADSRAACTQAMMVRAGRSNCRNSSMSGPPTDAGVCDGGGGSSARKAGSVASDVRLVRARCVHLSFVFFGGVRLPSYSIFDGQSWPVCQAAQP
jgi:hypothetical protein